LIQDSGYIKPDNSGTQASVVNMANSGSAITLRTAEFIPQQKRNISSQPELSSNTPSEVNLGSLENMQFKLRCVLNTKTTDDINTVQHLLDSIRTNGYKIMWYDFADSAAEDNNGQLITQIAKNSNAGTALSSAELTKFNIGTAFQVLKVHLFDMQFRHSAKRLVSYEISGIVLPVEESTL